MGSFVSQLPTVAEIWHDENGYYAQVFDRLYGKIPENEIFFNIQNSYLAHVLQLETPFFGYE